MHLSYRKTCRVCGSSSLTKVIDLGDQYLQGAFLKPGVNMPPMRKIPVSLVRCDPSQDEKACGLLQMSHTVPPEVLYTTYWYRSGTNQTMQNHLRGIVDEALSLLNQKDAKVLDIGCNDGTLLKFYPKEFMRVGVDPSDITRDIPHEIHVIQDLFPSAALSPLMGQHRFDIITSIAMFYDLEQPIEFVKNIREYLAPEGLWIFEMSYMPLMLKMNSYDTICHEHLEYYSLAVIETILKQCGMKLVKAELNDINGGSIRCIATHTQNFKFSKPKEIKALRQQEFDLELDSDKPYRDFQRRIETHRTELVSLLKSLKQKGKRIHVYGASTKGNTILQFCGIDHSIIDCAADRNPDKAGASTLGTGIPIVSEAQSRAMRPDYYLVLPWHFKQEFLDREKEILEKGVGMIFPLPNIEVVSRHPQAHVLIK